MDEHDGNVAFKCNYNDGGHRGFDGTCSKKNIKRHVRAGRDIWCTHMDNRCRQFYENDFQGIKPKHPCYESQIFENWKFGAGTYTTTKKFGLRKKIKHAKTGKVALLTTRHPRDDSEEKRIVFGIFKICRRDESDDGETLFAGNSEHAIRIPKAAARALPYWDFKKRPRSGEPKWGSGLFRYISDQEVTNFLHALSPRLQSPGDRAVLERLLECCGNLEPEDAANNMNQEVPAADLELKYGPGGEGERHRRLKEYVAQHPEELGLGAGRGRVEHPFVTGDRVDVLIKLDSGEHCVVEIEVEGRRSTLVGAHQALKYRALRTAELDDGTEPPHACLVAYHIPPSTREFCERHGVRALEIDPNQAPPEA